MSAKSQDESVEDAHHYKLDNDLSKLLQSLDQDGSTGIQPQNPSKFCTGCNTTLASSTFHRHRIQIEKGK